MKTLLFIILSIIVVACSAGVDKPVVKKTDPMATVSEGEPPCDDPEKVKIEITDDGMNEEPMNLLDDDGGCKIEQ